MSSEIQMPTAILVRLHVSHKTQQVSPRPVNTSKVLHGTLVDIIPSRGCLKGSPQIMHGGNEDTHDLDVHVYHYSCLAHPANQYMRFSTCMEFYVQSSSMCAGLWLNNPLPWGRQY